MRESRFEPTKNYFQNWVSMTKFRESQKHQRKKYRALFIFNRKCVECVSSSHLFALLCLPPYRDQRERQSSHPKQTLSRPVPELLLIQTKDKHKSQQAPLSSLVSDQKI